MDARVFHSLQIMQPNALSFRSDSSADVQNAVLDTFHVIVDGLVDGISPRLAVEGVKYVIVDLVDGQPPGEPWQTGPPTVASVLNTQLLAGSVSKYVARLNSAPGLKLAVKTQRFLVYRNVEWRPMLSRYSSVLGVAAVNDTGPFVVAGPAVAVNWIGSTTTAWRRTTDGAVVIVGSPQKSWSPLSAVLKVVGGQDYLFTGTMRFANVGQAHAKVVWRGDVAPPRAVTFLSSGRDGSGSADLRQVVAAPTGAVSAELMLMGGWAAGANPSTSYTGLAMVPVRISPRLDELQAHPEQRLSLWREVPQALLEPFLTTTSAADPTTPTIFLTAGQLTSIPRDRQVRLLTHSDLRFQGSWGVDSVPDATGIEKFTEGSSGRIYIPDSLISQTAPGTRLIWLEYKPGTTWPSDAVVRERSVQSVQGDYVSCSVAGCTIANLLLAPPLKADGPVARLAYAYSNLLRTPDGRRPPKLIEGDWAAIYSPLPTGYPSAANNPGAAARWYGLLFGHVVIVVSLAFAWVRRLW
jgi:hypothetical protein